jgi:hypothetical protein
MRWLTAILLLLLFGLAAIPATVGTVSAWMARRADGVQPISYISRDIHELSAARRRAGRRHDPDRHRDDKPF